jgi:hypothetical protein
MINVETRLGDLTWIDDGLQPAVAVPGRRCLATTLFDLTLVPGGGAGRGYRAVHGNIALA